MKSRSKITRTSECDVAMTKVVSSDDEIRLFSLSTALNTCMCMRLKVQAGDVIVSAVWKQNFVVMQFLGASLADI